ncbi:glycosyl hydrolase [Aspergillus granulosus]|uniref:Glycosyl hydrolase n=1 Tax=Aspergillus granulosus TaxID=176169 RepID=A0ABR4HB04_9EURO
MSFTNPIIPGFYPDPSCIRVGDTFYLVNSSFQFFPGIPIHKSKDLVNWEHIGNALSRPSQISLTTATTKVNNAARGEVFTGGLYAPTLRHHKGTFYIVCTMLTGSTAMLPTDDFQPAPNFIISTRDIEDPSSWSDIIPFDFYGIDPSLFFADDGKVYIQGSWIYGYTKHPATVIRQAEIDLSTGALLSETKDIWTGVTQKCPEGPHIYSKDGWFYLLIAEGGTHRRHKITIARSRDVWGPYESCPANPVLTAEGSSGVIQCAGHGDLFQDTLGQWWCVLLARREYGGSYPLGRETFMVSVQWEEGEWPVFSNVEVEQKTAGRILASKVVNDQFTDVQLKAPRTVYLRTPELANYSEKSAESGREIILAPSKEDLGVATGTMTFIGQRQIALESAAKVILPLSDESEMSKGASYGLTVYKDTFRYATLEYHSADSTLSLKIQEAGKELTTLNRIDVRDSASLELVISSTVEKYTFQCMKTIAGGAKEGIILGEVPCQALSGDDFTGRSFWTRSSMQGWTVANSDD